MTEKFETGYCAGCGKNVKVFGLMAEGNMVYRCIQCGMEVDQKHENQPADIYSDVEAQPPAPIKRDEPQPLQQVVQKKKLKNVMIAEDSKLLSEILNDLLINEGFAETVISSLDGDAFIQKFTESMINKNPPNLIILDINLPNIDGMNICVAIRSIEKAFGMKKGRPILFFTSKEIDSHLKKIMDSYPPARYINKGIEADPEKIAIRIKKVMETLLK
jgi:CheY-like chemotaxis protein